MQNGWNKDIATLGVGATFRLYEATYLILDIKGKNVLLKCISIRSSSAHSLLKVGAKLWKTSPLAVYGDQNFEVISVPDNKKPKAKSTLELDDSFVAMGSKDDPYKYAPLGRVAVRKKK